jgi:hypothetical protein
MVGLFYRLAMSAEPVAPLDDGAAGAGETQVVWSLAAECAVVAAEPPMFGGVGSSSGIISSRAACLTLAADGVSARTVACRERTDATAATLSRLGTAAATETGSLNIWPIFSL